MCVVAVLLRRWLDALLLIWTKTSNEWKPTASSTCPEMYVLSESPNCCMNLSDNKRHVLPPPERAEWREPRAAALESKRFLTCRQLHKIGLDTGNSSGDDLRMFAGKTFEGGALSDIGSCLGETSKQDSGAGERVNRRLTCLQKQL